MNTLCRMVIETRYEDLPDTVVSYAKRSILDTMAVIVGGSAMEGISTVVNFIKEKGGKKQSPILFYGGMVPASEAAMAIGPMARAMDSGDVHEEAAHSSEYTIPALLAATGLKDKITGKELITAYVVGQEVLVRIGIAIKAMSKSVAMGRSIGHPIFGIVASVGKLLEFNIDELENAQGIARAMTQPHDSVMYKPATLIVRVHHGFVCQDAINACLLAKRGITGPRQDILAAPRGYLGFAKWETEPRALTKELGVKWEMLDTMMKPYTSCKCTHTSIYGILDQMEEHGFKPEDIAHIDLEESSVNWSVVAEPKEKKWNPQTVPECQFSLPYVVATAVYDKHIFLDSYTPQAMKRQEVRELMGKVSAKEAPDLPPFAAVVNTELSDGRKFSKEYVYVKGHPKNRFTDQELIDKFKMCVPYSAYKLSNVVVDKLIDAIMNLEKIDDVADALILPLTPKS